MIKEAIILAGGLGTRLRSVVSDIPKCMAPVAGEPFLKYVIGSLLDQGVEHIIFSVGYLHEQIDSYLKEHYPDLDYSLTIEDNPLGTGGAIQLACQQVRGENVFILNGDTLFLADLPSLAAFHLEQKAVCSLSLKPMEDFDRYGSVELSSKGIVITFKEKQHLEKGLINGGVYALSVAPLLALGLPSKYSFEKDFLEIQARNAVVYGLAQDRYFIDIGIPEDYQRAQTELSRPLGIFDKSWTLFIDRDGVINHEKHLDYIHHWNEFEFYDGVKQAIKIFARVFGRIVVVTNQKGIGKGITKLEDLQLIHSNMVNAIAEVGGRIDKVYFCPDLNEDSLNRKPNPGMGLQAKVDFPEIDFSRALMVGNTISDMAFGRNLGVKTIFLPTTRPEVATNNPLIDAVYPSLIAFALDL
ncbi:MAG: HAD-IIIA family hydrolase [Chitinophagaceae bacterium]